jgi:hypothetical protein
MQSLESDLKIGKDLVGRYVPCPRPTNQNIHMKGVQTWTPQKENNVERRECFVLKQTYFIVNNINAIAWRYIDLRSSAVWRFSNSEQLPEDGQVRPKHVAILVILTLF